MKNSLRVKLNNLIRERGEVPYEELAKFTNEEGYKLSNMERRLRSSESPEIEPIMGYSKRGTEYIRAYRWRGAPKPEKPRIEIMGNKAVMILPR